MLVCCLSRSALRPVALLMGTGAILCSTALAGDPACPPSDHGCFVTGVPGCSDLECCVAVCAADPFCCEASWDNACVNQAFSICGAPPCRFTCPPDAIDEGEPCGESNNNGCFLPIDGDSSCCTGSDVTGCDDEACEAAVCGFNPFCCEVDWDSFCVSDAVELCPKVCSIGAAGFNTISCGDTFCATAWAEGGMNDTDWYEFTISSTSEVSFTVTTTLGLRFGLINNGGVPDCDITTALSPQGVVEFCESASITACLVPGTYWLFISPTAFSGFSCGGGYNDYSVSMSCGGACIPPACGSVSAGDCFEASGSPYCNDESCCTQICEVNPFCCDIAWDVTCVAEANLYCVECDLPCPPGAVEELEACGEDTNGGCNLVPLGTSSCCLGSGGAGCDDAVCEAAVCEVDPFCCEGFWDGFCVSIANVLCPTLCPLAPPAFESIECGMTICGTAWANGEIKDTDWYEITVSEITPITFSGVAQFPLVIGLADTGGFPDCAPGSGFANLNPYVLSNPCVPTSFTTCIGPGTWYLYVAPQTTNPWPCGSSGCDCPDLTGDGIVDGADLGALLSAWGSDDPCANLDGEGPVDGADLGILLSVWGPYTCPNAGKNGYTVTLTCGGECTGPANDFCEDAAPIALGDTPFSTVGATSGGPLLPIKCDEGFDLLFVRDVWFQFQAPETGILNVSTCNQASFDTRLAGYGGSCSALMIEGCNDDGLDCFGQTSSMNMFVEQGQLYWIRVGSYADTGVGTLTLTLN